MKVRGWLGVVLSVLGALCSLVACGSGGGEEDTLCVPHEQVFCRCGDGAPGAKQCDASGQAFDVCRHNFDGTACEESFGTPDVEDDPHDDLARFLEPCVDDDACSSGVCLGGVCTHRCKDRLDCEEPPASPASCMPFGDQHFCVPRCSSQEECDAIGPTLQCTYAEAIEGAAAVCMEQDGPVELPPTGTPCSTDGDCHLGQRGHLRVCEGGSCVTGCHVDTDCYLGLRCSGGHPGTCG